MSLLASYACRTSGAKLGFAKALFCSHVQAHSVARLTRRQGRISLTAIAATGAADELEFWIETGHRAAGALRCRKPVGDGVLAPVGIGRTPPDTTMVPHRDKRPLTIEAQRGDTHSTPEEICDLTSFQALSFPTMNYPTTPQNAGSSPSCKDNIP
jgi:hypothetical protein